MTTTESNTAYLGLGSNLGDRLANLRAGVAALAALPDTAVRGCSSVYATVPIGQTDQPDFLNGVCRLETRLAPEVLLGGMLAIEARLGRVRSGPAGGPRTLDLDLLLYGHQQRVTGELILPHPRLHQRAFVLYPLQEIAPDLVIPGRGAVSEWLAASAGQGIRRLSEGLCPPVDRG